ncbi:MAG: GGDEF domain-containing protein [Nitrospirae bacterium]|nr:GGDEF domain-containing protein [Nitrospirota bacterium]
MHQPAFWKSIPIRFAILVMLMVVPLLAVSLSGQRLVLRVFDQVQVLLGHTVERMVPVGNLNNLLLKSVMPAHDYLMYGDKAMAAELDGIAGRIDGILADASRAAFANPTDQALLAHVREEWQSAHRISREVLALPYPMDPALAQRRSLQIERHVQHALDYLDTLSDTTLVQLAADWHQAQSARGTQTRLVLASTALAVLLAVLASVGLTQMGRELRDNEARFRYLARHDPLTGLDNREEFKQRLDMEVRRSERFGHPFSLLMVDIDQFKQVNDTHGHPTGDEVLCDLARLLRGTLRGIEPAARYGGEEFAVILPETDLHGALTTAERLRAAAAGMAVPTQNGQEVAITVSIGVATFPDHGGDARTLVAKADKALYLAKRNGRDRVEGGTGAASGFVSRARDTERV